MKLIARIPGVGLIGTKESEVVCVRVCVCLKRELSKEKAHTYLQVSYLARDKKFCVEHVLICWLDLAGMCYLAT